ncbi:c-Myc-binding protein homolog [Bactrocera neohumeralis]|uniref:c-Myc-binding protein homolog n=1 Tax=Bactrocera tryoni TaxID=59916 RepID=UPI001A99913B|nr:c-Myc-binding protein homolog [Bactrocera tryoni]XP_050329546.1 c-Myc-binding protein homolog [Bactrocera neohumeralis]
MEVFLNEELTSEAKKDIRHAYLRECGITDKLNDIFKKLLQAGVRPDNPLDFIREELGDKPIPTETFENMEHELDDAHREIRRLRGILKELGVNNPDEQFCDAEAGPDEFENVASEFNNSLTITEINEEHTGGQQTS